MADITGAFTNMNIVWKRAVSVYLRTILSIFLRSKVLQRIESWIFFEPWASRVDLRWPPHWHEVLLSRLH